MCNWSILLLGEWSNSYSKFKLLSINAYKFWYPNIEGDACVWFQQDGENAHTANNVIGYLNVKFLGHVITRNYDIAWSIFSPDLIIYNYSCEGFLKGVSNLTQE